MKMKATRDGIKDLTSTVTKTREYITRCLNERALYEQNPHDYSKTYYTRVTDESLKDSISIQLKSIEVGITSQLFRSIEYIGFNDEIRLGKLHGMRDDEPVHDYVTKLLNT